MNQPRQFFTKYQLPLFFLQGAQAGNLVGLEACTYEANDVEYAADCGTRVAMFYASLYPDNIYRSVMYAVNMPFVVWDGGMR